MKKDIGFVEYIDEASASVAKDALHNYKLDGENKIKVRLHYSLNTFTLRGCPSDNVREEMTFFSCHLVEYQACNVVRIGYAEVIARLIERQNS